QLMLSTGQNLAQFSSLALKLLFRVIADSRIASPRPQHLIISQVKDSPDELVATPTTATADNTVPLTWSKDGTKALVNLRRLFFLRPLTLPKRTRAHIPISSETVEGLGPSLILQLGRIHLTPMADVKPRTTRQNQSAAPQSEVK
ncbi:MAG: hypothetical protein ACM3XM_16455, partial [Mycobacterium leprae]